MNEDMDGGSLQLPALSPSRSVQQLVDRVFEADDPPALIQHLLDTSDAAAAEDALSLQRLALQSLGNLFLGFTAALQNANYGEARDHFAAAAGGLSEIGVDQLRDLAVGLGLVTDAAVAIQAKNLGLALALMAQTQDYLRKAGRFAQPFEPLVAHIQPGALFLQATASLMGLEFDKARALIEQAYNAAMNVATAYYKENSAGYFYWAAYAHFFKASYSVYRIETDFSQFNYDNLVLELDLNRDAVQARDLFAQADIGTPILKNLTYINDGYLEILDVHVRLAPMMQMVFDATFEPDPRSFDLLRRSVRKANDAFVQAGPDAVPFIRKCDQLLAKINNLERLTKPKPVAVPARPRPRPPGNRRRARKVRSAAILPELP